MNAPCCDELDYIQLICHDALWWVRVAISSEQRLSLPGATGQAVAIPPDSGGRGLSVGSLRTEKPPQERPARACDIQRATAPVLDAKIVLN